MAKTRARPVGAGTRCRHCGELIRRTRIGDLDAQWLHEATTNIYCATNLPGLTAHFAEPA